MIRFIFLILTLILSSKIFASNTSGSCPGKRCDGDVLLTDVRPTLLKKEKEFQQHSCRGEIEVRLPDRTRVDCLTDTHAIEYDFGNKWAEAIGQSLYYAFQTNKKAGIVLILKKETDIRYYHRLNSVIMHNKLPIDVWVIATKSRE